MDINVDNDCMSSDRSASVNDYLDTTSVMHKQSHHNPDDEWKAFGNLVACNARTWFMENKSFARRYKAALSAVNAKFEMEAINLPNDTGMHRSATGTSAGADLSEWIKIEDYTSPSK